MIELKKETEQAIVKQLPELHRKTRRLFVTGGTEWRQLSTVIADIRDYFHWQVVNCKDKARALKLISDYESYMLTLDSEKTMEAAFYSGFFFALVNILILKFQIKALPGEKLTYEEFEKSFKESIKELGPLPGAGQE